jgi:hypothetical protein
MEGRGDTQVRRKVQSYCATYGIQPTFESTGPYLLEQLTEFWRNSQFAGCYVLYNDNLEILRIGKASITNTVERRLRQRFRFDVGLGNWTHCARDKALWTQNICFVEAIAVNKPYEAASLEEFLIWELRPTYNNNGYGNRREFL